MARIIVVSNRVLDARRAAQAGGVAVALANVVQRHHGFWAGWDGQIVDALPGDRPRRKQGALVTSPLTSEEHAGFYLGYSNSVLWPVMHNRLDLAQFEAGYYRIYSDVNARFARMLAKLVEPGDIIWVHDYQFIPLGLELRKLGIANPIGFFLHIPFPPSRCFLAVPEHRELARAFAAYDLVGLQTRADVANLIDYLQQGVHGRLLTDGRIRAYDRIMSIECFPIGIELKDFGIAGGHSLLVQGRPEAKRFIGIDRLDYSKGLPQKFRAFGRFLDMSPAYRKRVVLTQIAPPTRESVEAYTDIRKELEALSGSINGRFGELDWVPIHYIHRPIPRVKLGDIYRASSVGIVTPLRDGMNLVAKEYIVAQDPADPGVLILSQFAGAAEQLDEALIVNPYNIDECALAMRAAIEMPLSERLARHASLYDKIRKNDVTAWADSFLAALQRPVPDDPALSARHACRYHAALARLSDGSAQTAAGTETGGSGNRRKPPVGLAGVAGGEQT